MKISVVMSVLNGEKTLERAFESIQNQVRKVDEVIIVNDASIDDTQSIIASWMERLPIILIENKKNLGIARSLNKAINISKSDWIFRLDADDYWMPNHIESLEGLINKQKEIVLVSGRAMYISEGIQYQISKFCNSDNFCRSLMISNPLVHSASCFNKKAFLVAGQYNPKVLWEDYDLWIRLARVGQVAFSQKITTLYYLYNTSTSRVNYYLAIESNILMRKKAIKFFCYKFPFFSMYAFIRLQIYILCVKLIKLLRFR